VVRRTRSPSRGSRSLLLKRKWRGSYDHI
jgi:hypothetical protein